MKFSIATFNLENLTTAGASIYNEARPHYVEDQYRLKINWVRNQLLKMNADIIGFQEVFEEQALRDCLAGTYMESWNLFVANPTGKTPVNAILSKFPIVSTEVADNIPFVFKFFDEKAMSAKFGEINVDIPIKQFSRPVLKAVIQMNEKTSVLVIVLHLKSKRPILPDGIDRDSASYPEIAKANIRSMIRRGIESCGVRQILSEEINKNQLRPVLIVGDLNDNDTAVTSQAIIGDPPFHKLSPQEKNNRWKQVFQNSKDIQARKSIENFHFTYIHNGHYESLDNIFVSNHFSDLNSDKIGRVIDVRVYNDHVIDDTISHERKPVYVSDHGQVVVNMALFEPKQTPPFL